MQRAYVRALEGIRIADFAWVGAGPLATRFLASLGAEVIRVETSVRPDPLRLLPPFKGGIAGVNRSGYFNDRNAGKLSISINLNHPGGVEVAKRLIRVSDVVINSFRPGTMARWGLDYESVRLLRRDIVYVDMPFAGVSGRYRDYGGYGLALGALTGFAYLTAYDQTKPMGTGTNYPDHAPNPSHAAVAIVAALCLRRKTGQGQYVEVSQLESTLAFLGPALVWASLTGENPVPCGNDRQDAVVHGVFQCRGTDRWVAITVFTEDEWTGLVRAMGNPPWSTDPRFASSTGRMRYRAELAERVRQWVQQFEAEAIVELLQAHGVPAGIVEDAADLLADPHLASRRFWKRLAHPETGPAVYTGSPVWLEGTPGEVLAAAPTLGEHTDWICKEVLGMDDKEVSRLKQEGGLR